MAPTEPSKSDEVKEGHETPKTQRGREIKKGARSGVQSARGAPRSGLRVDLREGRQQASAEIENGGAAKEEGCVETAEPRRDLQKTPESMRLVERNVLRRCNAPFSGRTRSGNGG